MTTSAASWEGAALSGDGVAPKWSLFWRHLGCRACDARSISIWWIGLDSVNFRRMLSVGAMSKWERQSAAGFSIPGTWGSKKLNWRAWPQQFHNFSGICLTWKNRLKAMLSVMSMIGFFTLHKTCQNLSNAKCKAKVSLAYIVENICPVVNRRCFPMLLCFCLHSLQSTARSPQRVRWRHTFFRVVGRVMRTVKKVWLSWRGFCWCQKSRLCWLEPVEISCPPVAIGTVGVGGGEFLS